MSLVPVPYQDNGCDCGVFVCRYAYNLYMMRHKQFTWASYENEMPSFASLITRGPAIQFDMYDIGRIRDEISALIDKLLKLYLTRLEEQEKAAREAKHSAKQKESYVSVNRDAGNVTKIRYFGT
jgi:Ulp1 family protease